MICNQFQNDIERIQELKTCLEKSHELLHNAEKMEDVYDMVRTLIRDTLSRYEEDKKFLTADVKVEQLKTNSLDTEFEQLEV